MASQALLTPDPPLELQRDVQRKLGRCLLRLQQYEILLKALVAHGDIAGPQAELQSVRDAHVACAQKKTLGTLVGMLTERHLTSAEADDGTQRYGRGSWRQVIHESRQFEIRRTLNKGCGEVWYRSHQEEANVQGKRSS